MIKADKVKSMFLVSCTSDQDELFETLEDATTHIETEIDRGNDAEDFTIYEVVKKYSAQESNRVALEEEDLSDMMD